MDKLEQTVQFWKQRPILFSFYVSAFIAMVVAILVVGLIYIPYVTLLIVAFFILWLVVYGSL